MCFRRVIYPKVPRPDRRLAAKRRQGNLIGVYLDEGDDALATNSRLL